MGRLLLILLCLSANISAAELYLEKGDAFVFYSQPVNFMPAEYASISLRSNHIETILGGWYGPGRNDAKFIALGLVDRTDNKYFLEYSAHFAHFRVQKSNRLDGDNQLLLSVGIGRKFDNLYTVLKYRHFSNVNTQGNNRGIEFFTLLLGVEY